MANIFLAQPETLHRDTEIVRCRELADGNRAIVLAENPLRPAGGGQPRDYGIILHADEIIPVEGILKEAGDTWIVLPRGQFNPGDSVTAKVDPARRRRLSQAHSLTHLMMATIREFVPGYQSKGADIAEDGVGIELRFLSDGPVPKQSILSIDRLTRSRVLRSIPVRIEVMKSPTEASSRYPHWRIDPDLALSGKIRVVVIEDIDANPCSGSHVASTTEIGPFAVTEHSANAGNLNRLRLNKQEVWTYWY